MIRTSGAEALAGALLRTPSPPLALVAFVTVWMLVALTTGFSLPYRLEVPAGEQVLDSAAVAALLVPIALSGAALNEGPHHLVVGGSRELTETRLLLVVILLLANMLSGLLLAAVTPLPSAPYLRDIAILWGAHVAAMCTVGPTAAWTFPVVVLAIFSLPGVVPLHANLLFSTDGHGLLAVLVVLSASTMYLARGSRQSKF